MMNTYFNWFKKLINVIVDIFYLCAIVATLCVFTSFLSGTIRLIAIALMFIVFSLIVHFFKDKVKTSLNKIVDSLKKLDTKKMVLIIVLSMIIFKVIYTIFFGFDSTKGGDIELYNQIGDELINNGVIASDTIAHLLGIGVHLAVFKMLNIPLHIGMFVAILIATVINFFSFKKIVGKEKAFMALMLYILMPSTTLLSFCITHEVLVYLYLSMFLYTFNSLLASTKNNKTIVFVLLVIVSSILVCFVNPGGYIVYVIMFLSIVLSNIKFNKKIFVMVTLVVSLLGSSLISNAINANSGASTSLNTYVILIHGTNPESLGEQVDGYPMHIIRQYLKSNGIYEFNDENYLMGAKAVLIEQCLYLLSHPVNLIKLVANKIYLLWSGNHYSIELAHVYGGVNDIEFYVLLAVSTLIYLFILTIGFVFKVNEEDEISISNYKLALLGVICVTMASIVTNKYSLYVTLFIYLISFYRIDIDENK